MPVDKIETLRREGLDAYKKREYDTAEFKFFSVIAEDWRSPAAGYATDYLKKIVRETGAADEGKRRFEELVKSGQTRAVQYGPEHESFFAAAKQPGKLEEHLFGLLKLGGMLAARSSVIGVVLNEMGFTDPAAYFLDQAQSIAAGVQKKAVTLERRFSLDRPLHYAFSRVVEKSEYPTLDTNQLETIPFVKMQSTKDPDIDPFVETNARAVRRITRLRLAFLDSYDSNVIKLADNATVPAGPGRKSGSSPTYFLSFEAQSDPASRMSYGAGYSMISRQKSRVGLDDYSAISHVPGLWFSWWDASDLELRLRYDYSFTKHGNSRTDVSKRMTGPSMHIAKDFGGGGRGRMFFSFSSLSNMGDSDGRTGKEYSAKIDFATRNKKTGIEPRVGYGYLRDVALSGLYNSVGSDVHAGTSLLMGRRSVLDIGTLFRWTSFARYPGGKRSDTLKVMELKGIFPLGESAFSFLANAVYEIQGSSDSAQAYSRWALGGGFTAAFDW